MISTHKYIDFIRKYRIDFVSWYALFLGALPYFIINNYGFDNLKYYLPVVDLIANTFTSAGKADNLFREVYNLNPQEPLSYISLNFINLVALSGVSWNGIEHAMNKNDLGAGIRVTLIMYLITYLLPTNLIPFIVKWLQNTVNKIFNLKDKPHFHGPSYLFGLSFSLTLALIEMIIIERYLKTIN